MTTTPQRASQIQSIESDMRYSIDKIVKNAANNKNVTAGFTSAMTLLIMQLTEKCITRDLVAFKDHAKRKSINDDDALLLSRKTKFHAHLNRYREEVLGISPKLVSAKKSTRSPGIRSKL